MAPKPNHNIARPPVVTIMGHVDHGKTTLLDTIRHTRVALTEHGGITQHTAAYQAEYQGQRITFIDTPGHAAFSKMRARGASVTDLVILVIAGTEGVKPQTVESIKHIQTAKVPLIVAVNKKDMAGFSLDMVKAQLAEHQVFCEGYGGQVPCVAISARNNEGIDQLLELILLMSEMENFTADPNAPAQAVVIESHLDKHRGHLATVIVKAGTLTPGQSYFIETKAVKIKSLFNIQAKPVPQALPSDPVEVMGFTFLPPVGSLLTSVPQSLVVPPAPPSLLKPTPAKKGDTPDTTDTPEEPPKPTINVILKADTAGTLEAILQAVSQEELVIVHQGVGSVTEADVILAQSTTSGIIAFNVPVTTGARNLARVERVKIQTFTIIYELIDFLDKKILSLLEPTIFEAELGAAVVLQVFDIRGVKIAGCKVESGRIAVNQPVHLTRHDHQVANARIVSVKIGKVDTKSVEAGGECGLVLEPIVDFKVGDVLKSYKIVEKA